MKVNFYNVNYAILLILILISLNTIAYSQPNYAYTPDSRSAGQYIINYQINNTQLSNKIVIFR